MPAIKEFLFDCDNTLVLSEELAFEACADLANEILEAHGKEKRYTGPELMTTFVGQNFRGVVSGLEKNFGFTLTNEQRESYVKQEEDRVIATLKQKAQPCVGANAVLQRLYDEKKYGLAVVSSSALRRVVASVEKVDQAKFFPKDHIFSAATSLPVPTTKPDPAIYQFACEKIGVKPEECIAVEDSKSGTLSAVNAGIWTIAYVGSYHDPQKAHEVADMLVAHGAKVVMNHWDEFDACVKKIEAISEYPAAPQTLPIVTPARDQGSSRFVQHFSPSDKTPTRSRSSSLWTAPSPRQVPYNSSPALPSLPRAPERDLTSSFQSPQHPKTDSSAYYTAVWGSPYDLPPLNQRRRVTHGHYTSSGSEALEDSPSQIPSLREALRPLEQSPIGSYQQQSSALRTNSSPRPQIQRSLTTGVTHLAETRFRHGFTQDWLSNSLAGNKSSERGNWWSDDSGDSDIENSKSDAIGSRKHSLKLWNEKSANTNRTSIQGPLHSLDLPNSRSKPSQQFSLPTRTTSAHKPSPSEVTVKQEDFDSTTRPDQQRMSSVTNTLSSIFASLSNRDNQKAAPKLSEMDKPLPQPPLNRTASEAPTLQHSMSYYSPTREKRPSISSAMSFQRPKKKVFWRGKTCIIAMPFEDEGHPRGLIRVTPHFEDDSDSTLGNGQSRDVFPDPFEGVQELEKKDFRVSIPNKKAWDDYVDQLKEEKLRALGVSFGDEDGPLLPPKGPLPMIRQVSNQIPHAPIPLPRPPSLNPGSHPSQPLMSRSPGLEPLPGLSQQPVRPGFQHLPRQSVSFHADPSLASYAPPMQHQPTNVWPHSGFFSPPLNSRGASPLTNRQRPGLQTAISHNSSLHRGSIPDGNRRVSELAQSKSMRDDVPFHQQWQQPRASVGSHRPSINGNSFRPTEDHSVSRFVSQPDIASPVPKGHHHNLSQTLQKEIEDAERVLEGSDYHLEESVRREFEEDDDSKSLHDDLVSPSTMIPTVPNNGHRSFTRVTSGSDLDTNPSLQNSPAFSTFPGRPPFSKHGSKMSMSTLNVNAQEFVFEPQKPTQPDMFSFGRYANPSTNSAKTWPALSHPRHKDSGPQSNLNVAAPSFTPSTVPTFSAPNREFSFSSSGPTFRPDAPTFQPVALSSSFTSDHSGSDTTAPRIFGKIDFSQLAAKPTKTSKAIPIVKPVSARNSLERDDEGQEDETGRITQAEGRQKRMRRDGDDGDSVPLFATPKEEVVAGAGQFDIKPTETLGSQDPDALKEDEVGTALGDKTKTDKREILNESPEKADGEAVTSKDIEDPPLKLDIDAKNTISHLADEADREASPMERATGQLQELVDDLLTSEAASVAEEPLVSERFNKPWEPVEMQDEESIAVGKTLGSESDDIPLSTSKTDEIDFDVPEVAESPAVQELSQPPHKSSLSATAAPFEFKPSINGTVVTLNSSSKAATSASVGPSANSKFASEPDPLANMVFSPQSTSEEEVIAPAKDNPQSSPQDNPSSANRVVSEGKSAGEPVTERQEDVEAIHRQIDNAVQELGRQEDYFHELEEDASALETDLAQSPEHSESSSSSGKSLPRSIADEISDSVASVPSPRLGSLRRDRLPSASPNRLAEAFQYLPGPERSYSADSAVVDFVTNNPRLSPSYRPGRSSSIPSPVHRLTANDIPVSDWDDVVDSEDEVKFLSRTGFFDKKVDSLVGATVKAHLGPLEQSLAAMRESIAQISTRSMSKRGRRSAEVKDSDADDEDDEEAMDLRTRSPLKDRKLEKIKASINDLISTQQEFARANDVSQIARTVAELKGLMQSQMQEPRPKSTEIKNIVEEAVGKQLRGKSAQITSSIQSAGVEKLQLQITGLESMLKHAEARADVELQCRMLAEKALDDSTRVLRATEDEASAQRESAEEAQRSLHAYYEERKQAQQRDMDSDETIEALRTSILGLNEKNTALEGTLAEYRLSSTQWREEIDEAKVEKLELQCVIEASHVDSSNLKRTIQALKSELEEGIRGRQAMNIKFERIQEDIARTTQDLARDQSEWRHRDEEHKARHDLLSARLEAEARTRERLEDEIERLESQEKEAMRSRFMAERYKEEIEQLSTQIQQSTSDEKNDRDAYAELKRDLDSIRETAKINVERVRASMEAALESSNHQARLVREDLQATVTRLQSQLAAAENDTAALKARHELMLDEASESRNEALREAAEARESALQEHFRFHERTIASVTQQLEAKLTRALEEKDVDMGRLRKDYAKALEEKDVDAERLRKDHTRALEERDLDLDRLRKDHAGKEAHFAERSTLMDEKVAHYVDHVAHLEEKLAIAKSAAHAAVQAVQSARESTTSSPAAKVAGSPAPSTTQDKSIASPTTLLPSLAPPFSTNKALDTLPPKISPQALRETILVLTEQLRDREARLEALDPKSPQIIKNLELETSWLRELLAVRLDDLKELIASLSQPGGGYDVAHVKDAAIRLKAGLEMELQEREKRGPVTIQGPSQLAQPASLQFPSLSSITNLATSTPRALPLAAAAAWGNWRKTGGLSESFGASWGGGSVAQTPSKPPTTGSGVIRGSEPGSTSSRLSGLLTPPGTGAKAATPAAMMEGVRERLHAASTGTESQRRPLGRYAASGSVDGSRPGTGGSVMVRKGRNGSRDRRGGEIGTEEEAPRTPTMNLMRRASYDADAESTGHYSLGRYVREREEEESAQGEVLGREVGVEEGNVFVG